MAYPEDCRASNFLRDPFCSVFNTLLLALLVAFAAASVGVVAWHIYLDLQAQTLKRGADAEYRRMIEEHEHRHLLEDYRFGGPPSRDLSGPDDSSTPPPNPARAGSRWDHLRRMMGLKTPTPPSSTYDPTSTSSNSSNDAVYIGGEVGRRAQSNGRRIKPVLPDTTEDIIQETEVDTHSGGGGPVVALGPTRGGAIAQRRQSPSGAAIFDIEIDK